MKKKKIRKSEKWNKGRSFSKLRDYKFENEKDESRLDKYSYEKYQRKSKIFIDFGRNATHKQEKNAPSFVENTIFAT